MYKPKYTIKEIREAVDIVIGDDGFQSKEVIRVIKIVHMQNLLDSEQEYKVGLAEVARAAAAGQNMK